MPNDWGKVKSGGGRLHAGVPSPGTEVANGTDREGGTRAGKVPATTGVHAGIYKID